MVHSISGKHLNSLESQGRIARTDKIDNTLSCTHLTNLHLSDSLVQFVVKAKLQLLATNSLLHVYYPDSVERKCKRCGFYTETESHILNGCKMSKSYYQKRHNRIADVIVKAVRDVNPNAEILTDQPVKPCHFVTVSNEIRFEGVNAYRPDACVINHENRTCLLLEVAVPFDPFVPICFQSKFDKYFPLCQRIQDTGFDCKLLIFIVGSLGSIHSHFVSGLRLAGIPIRRGKGIAKYCSVSAMIGSRLAWKKRCRESD